MSCPSCGAKVFEAVGPCPTCGRDLRGHAANEPVREAMVPALSTERRRATRLEISVDMVLRRISRGGTVLQEERTVANNIARHGARVLTTMTTLGVDDLVVVQEVGTDFQARSAVRHASTGKDNVHRIGVEFLDWPAPDRLVPTDTWTARAPRRSVAIHADSPSATPRQGRGQRAEAPPPPTPPPSAQEPSPPAMPAPGPASPAAHIPGGTKPVRESVLEDAIHRAEKAYSDGRRLLAEDKPWDAIQILEAALVFAKGTKVHQKMRVLLARAFARNPRWLKRSEETLLGVIQDDPQELEAYIALGVLYKAAGIKSRARAMFARALDLDPRHPQAAAELRFLETAGE